MLYWIVLVMIQLLVRPFLKITWAGMKNIPKSGPLIVASNHQRYWDVLLLALTFAPRKIHFLAKSEFFQRKLTAILLNALGAFSVKRGTADFTARRDAQRVLKNGDILGIFPEGTLNFGQKPKKLRGGAAMLACKSKACIVPVKITYHGTTCFLPAATIYCCGLINPEEFGFNRQLIANRLEEVLKI